MASYSYWDGPGTFEEDKKGSDGTRWVEAAESDWKSLLQNGTWEFVKRPPDLLEKDIVDTKWVFRIKIKADGNIEKYEARILAKR